MQELLVLKLKLKSRTMGNLGVILCILIFHIVSEWLIKSVRHNSLSRKV